MSCNYYIHTKDMEMAFDLMPRVSMVQESREFEIHLCQICGGRKPLFESHGYSSFRELKNILEDTKYTFVIKDEYGREITIQEFISHMTERTNVGYSRVGTADENPNCPILLDDDGFEFVDCEFG